MTGLKEDVTKSLKRRGHIISKSRHFFLNNENWSNKQEAGAGCVCLLFKDCPIRCGPWFILLAVTDFFYLSLGNL